MRQVSHITWFEEPLCECWYMGFRLRMKKIGLKIQCEFVSFAAATRYANDMKRGGFTAVKVMKGECPSH
jgi:hypothetical protein